MCVAMPGKIIEIKEDNALVSFGSIERNVVVSLVENLKEGDYILVHAGFAINKIDKEEALETLKLFKELSGAIKGDSNED